MCLLWRIVLETGFDSVVLPINWSSRDTLCIIDRVLDLFIVLTLGSTIVVG